jgi:hypothetical protein
MAEHGKATTAPTAAASSDPAGASLSGYGSSDARAPLRWPFTSRAQQERVLRQRAEREESPSELESDEESQDEPGHSDAERGQVEEGIPGTEASSHSSSSVVLDSQQAQEDQPPVAAESTITAEIIAARASAMFVVGAAAVQPSGLLPVGSKATKALVKLANEHMRGISDAEIKALSTSFGNFDRRVGLGWLLGDALRPVGLPLMIRERACAVGVSAQRIASKIKSEVRDGKLAIQRELCKLAADDSRRAVLQIQVEEVEARVLRADVDVGLPPVEPAAAAAAQATGSRKRAREAEPSHEAIVAELDNGLLSARKWVKEAEAELLRATRTAEEKRRVMARMERKVEEARQTKKAQATIKETQKLMKFMNLWEDSRAERLLAIIEEREAEIYLLKAQLEVSDSEKSIYVAQWGHACELIDE